MAKSKIPMFSVWINRKNCKLVTVLGFTKIPEANNENAIIVGTVGSSTLTFSAEVFVSKFERYDNDGKK